MDKYQKQVEQTLLDNEKEALNELKKTYTNALKETKLMVKRLQADVDILEKANLENKSILQSKIYQLNYQKAMDEQLTAILKVVETENVRNTQSFLTKMYEDSFLGINYSLQQKGIPILMPINHKLIVDSINKPIEDLNFKDRLYANNKEFKKAVKSEISRGLALGKSYHEIAQQINLVTQVDLNKTYRIARTEGGRVSSEAKFESMQHAKSVGADIVKVWDSTLDHRTRELHAILDQQWEEIDEPFKVQGMEAMYPHGFGRADMDINCRCVLLSVPRWDLEGEVTKYDNENGYLIKVRNYQDWKDGYYTKIEELDIVKDVIAEAEGRISGYKKVAKTVSDKVDKVLGKETKKEKVADVCDSLIIRGKEIEREIMIVTDAKGNVLSEQIGTYNNVSPDDKTRMIFYGDEQNLIVLHNHPESSAFSYPDVANYQQNVRINELIVAGHDGTIYSLKFNGNRIETAKFKKQYENAEKEFRESLIVYQDFSFEEWKKAKAEGKENELKEKLKQNKDAINRENKDYTIKIWEKIAKENGWTFTIK